MDFEKLDSLSDNRSEIIEFFIEPFLALKLRLYFDGKSYL